MSAVGPVRAGVVAALALLALTGCSDRADHPTPTGSPATTFASPGRGDATTYGERTWRSAPSMPSARTEVTAATLNGRIYVVGGLDADGNSLATVEVFDPEREAWGEAAPLPEGRDHQRLAVLRGRLYSLGGFSRFLGPPTADVWVYDEHIDRWNAVASLPQPRGAHAMAVADGRIWVFGGVGEDSDTTLSYDPAADHWDEHAPLPANREHLAGGAVGGSLYAIGGRNGSNTGRVDRYDIAADRWTREEDMPVARSGTAAVVRGTTIIVAGGESLADGDAFGDVEILNTVSKTWSGMPRLGTPRHGLGLAIAGGSIWALGGGPEAGLTQAVDAGKRLTGFLPARASFAGDGATVQGTVARAEDAAALVRAVQPSLTEGTRLAIELAGDTDRADDVVFVVDGGALTPEEPFGSATPGPARDTVIAAAQRAWKQSAAPAT